jgi:hypothetical protein
VSTEVEIAFAGKLSALEYVLEVMMDNELAFIPQESAERFRTDLLDRPGYIPRGPVDVELLPLLEATTSAELESFLGKVAAREADMRRQVEADGAAE